MKIIIKSWLLLLENLAQRGTAAQSTTSGSQWSADHAIDGMYSGPCAVTNWEFNPWWRLDLQAVYELIILVVTYSDDSFPGMMRDIQVRFGNSLRNNGIYNPRCSMISSDQATLTVTYSCGELGGQYVMISRVLESLSVCEVEVYETDFARRQFMKIAFNSSANLTDPTVTDQVLKELTSALAVRGITNVTLIWSQTPKEEVIQRQVKNDPC